jgi:hypothetical protein
MARRWAGRQYRAVPAADRLPLPRPLPSLAPGFASPLIDQIFDLWVAPELNRRRLRLTRAEIRKVVVELEADRPPRVLINDEARILGRARAYQAVVDRGSATHAQISELGELRPHAVGPNSGWICFLRLGDHQFVAFDFTYNRARAGALLNRAQEFLAAAQHAGEAAPGVAIENAHSAAELTVQAQMLLQQTEARHHQARRDWLAAWARHQNSPQRHADVLWNLADLREPARYGSGDLRLKKGRLIKILATVQEMIDIASVRLG